MGQETYVDELDCVLLTVATTCRIILKVNFHAMSAFRVGASFGSSANGYEAKSLSKSSMLVDKEPPVVNVSGQARRT